MNISSVERMAGSGQRAVESLTWRGYAAWKCLMVVVMPAVVLSLVAVVECPIATTVMVVVMPSIVVPPSVYALERNPDGWPEIDKADDYAEFVYAQDNRSGEWGHRTDVKQPPFLPQKRP